MMETMESIVLDIWKGSEIFVAANGLREGDDETEKVFAGVGVVEVIEGLDCFGWGLELVGRRDEWDLLSMTDKDEKIMACL